MEEDTADILVIQGIERIWMTHLIHHCNEVCFLIQVLWFSDSITAKRCNFSDLAVRILKMILLHADR